MRETSRTNLGLVEVGVDLADIGIAGAPDEIDTKRCERERGFASIANHVDAVCHGCVLSGAKKDNKISEAYSISDPVRIRDEGVAMRNPSNSLTVTLTTAVEYTYPRPPSRSVD